MILNKLPLALLAGFILAVSTGHAVELTDLYVSEQLVIDQTEEQRLQAQPLALESVLIKVSGNADVARSDLIKQALNNSQDYLEQFSYLTDETAVNVTTKLILRFDRLAVNRLLQTAQLPIWGSNRPALLSWLVSSKNGRRQISGQQNSLLADLFSRQAKLRGLPLYWPQLDAEDRKALSTDDLWNFSQERISIASQRYQKEGILAGRVYRDNNNLWVGEWLFLFAGQADSLNFTANDITTLAAKLVDSIVNKLARKYAVSTLDESSGGVVIEVGNVSSIDAYVSLFRYLQNLTPVKQVQVRQIKDQRIKLELITQGQLSQLQSAIALDTKLIPTVGVEWLSQDTGEQLFYEWYE